MGYLYQGKCLDTVQSLNENFAQDCTKAFTSLGQYVSICSGDASGVTVNTYALKDGVQWNTVPVVLQPQQISCEVSLLNQTGFMWELALILVAGFTIRAIIKAFQ
jgi:hypothetical protein